MSTENQFDKSGRLNPQFIKMRFQKEHPKFVKSVFLSAIIVGVSIGIGVYALSNSVGLLHSRPAALEIIGSKSISLDGMKKIVHKNNLIVYWLGGDKDSVFSLEYKNPTEPILANMTPNTVGELWGVKIVSIHTYLSSVSFKDRLLGRIHEFADTISVDSLGNRFLTNPDYPSEMVVDIVGTDRVVVIDYLVPQTIAELKADAERLALVR